MCKQKFIQIIIPGGWSFYLTNIMARWTEWLTELLLEPKKLNFLCYVPTFGQIELLKTNISIWNFVVSPNWKLKCCIKLLKHLNKFQKQRSLDYDEKYLGNFQYNELVVYELFLLTCAYLDEQSVLLFCFILSHKHKDPMRCINIQVTFMGIFTGDF